VRRPAFDEVDVGVHRCGPMKTLQIAAALAVSLCPAQAKLVKQPVAYEHAGVKLEGYLVYDDEKVSATAKAPGVLVVHEWWGLNQFAKGRADALARLGFVAFALDMYGAGLTTEDPKRAGELAGQFYGSSLMADRARAGLDQLIKSGLADESKLAAIGFCFGGATCQALAYSGAPLAGIVSFHGSLIPLPAEAAAKVRSKILVLHGAVDPFIKPEEIRAFTQALDSAKLDYQFVSYSGAVHAFTNPGADEVAAEKGLKGLGYNEPAARRSWAQMRAFFAELFPKPKS